MVAPAAVDAGGPRRDDPVLTVLGVRRALLNHVWVPNVRIVVEPNGNIASVSRGTLEGCDELLGTVVPGMVNLHCHAFQRAMAGLGQKLGPGEATFWIWRKAMYDFAGRLGPEDVWAIAAFLYLELLRHGCTAVAEFHYLHNDPDGRPYDDPALLSVAIHEAAREVGIALTHLPTLYMTGGFDLSPEPGQRRFVLDPDRLFRIVERMDGLFRDDPNRRLGLALHSLRAVPPGPLRESLAEQRRRDPAAPVHIHVAEQTDEVESCRATRGRRPVEELMALAEPGPHWCLVHATHLTDAELAAVTGSGAVVGLCPSTEADLGDGLFRLADFLAAGGRFGIGSDSNVGRDPFAELRLLEYGQRLAHRRRVVGASRQDPHCGANLYRRAMAGGAQAAGRPVGRLAPGFRADLVVLDDEHPDLVGRDGDLLLDSLVFGGAADVVRHVMVGGVWRLRDRSHPAEAAIEQAWRRAMARLMA